MHRWPLQDKKKRLELLLSLTKIPLEELADLHEHSNSQDAVNEVHTEQQHTVCSCYPQLSICRCLTWLCQSEGNNCLLMLKCCFQPQLYPVHRQMQSRQLVQHGIVRCALCKQPSWALYAGRAVDGIEASSWQHHQQHVGIA